MGTAISGKVGAVYMQTDAVAQTFTTEAMTDEGAHTRYYITNRSKAYWDKASTLTVYVDGNPADEADYVVEYAGGYVEFDASQGASVITVTGKYLTLAQAGGFFNWSLDLSMNVNDVTTFASSGWKESLPTLKDWKASAEAYWQDESITDFLGTEVVIVFYVDVGANAYRYEGHGIISSNAVETAVDDIINESVEIQGNGGIYYRAG
jgi:hypothetical protein